MEKYPRIDRNQVTKKVSLSKAQASAVKVIRQYNLEPKVVSLREKYKIHPSGFTRLDQVQLWLCPYQGLEEDTQKVFRDIKLYTLWGEITQLCKSHGLAAERYARPFMDYLLLGFRERFFFTDETTFFCREVEDLSSRGEDELVILVSRDCTKRDLLKFYTENIFKTKSTNKQADRVKKPKKFNRDAVIRDLRRMSRQKLEEMCQAGGLSAMGTKEQLIVRLMKKSFNLRVSVDTVRKIKRET